MMNEIMLYGGLLLAIVCFLLAVFLFFFHKISSVIKYFYNINSKKVFKNSHGYKAPKQKAVKSKHENKKLQINNINETEQKTELLDVAQNYATALLDADSTELLPELNDEN